MLFKKKNSNVTGGNISSPEDFKSVYDTYWEKVYAVCYNNMHKVELSQEMTQDIFMSLWEKKDTLKIVISIEHYLIRAAKNKVSEHIRNKTIRSKHLNCALQDYCSESNCTEEDIAFSELVEALGMLVEQLPCRCREVFKLSREKGLTNRQIAEQFQISERAVEYHISKAIGFLKENMTEFK